MDIEYMIFAGPTANSAQATQVLVKTYTGLSDADGYARESAFNAQLLAMPWTSGDFNTWIFQMVRFPPDPRQQVGSGSWRFFSATAAEQQAIVDQFTAVINAPVSAPPPGKHHKHG